MQVGIQRVTFLNEFMHMAAYDDLISSCLHVKDHCSWEVCQSVHTAQSFTAELAG